MSYHKKIAPKREGPFEIDEVLGPVTYSLKLPKTWKIHDVFHAILDSYCDHTLKMKYMKEISHNNYPNYWKGKNFTKSNQSLNIDDKVEDTNAISNGKAIPSLKQHGKMSQHSLMMGTCCSNIKNLTLPTIHHHNMFLQKTKSTPILKTSSIFVDKNK
jgi:hypothetical protein